MFQLNRFWRHAMAVGLAVAAQLVRIPVHPADRLPITYIPFIVLSCLGLGMWPGLVTATLSGLGFVYFGLHAIGSHAATKPLGWERLTLLVVTGLLASGMAELLRRSEHRLSTAELKTTSILESISDGFNTFDREWRYTYVNAAAAKLVGKTPEELLGKKIWELWPHAADSPFGVAYRRSVAENIPLQVEAFYPDPLNAWFEVRCYPSPEGLSLFFNDTTQRKQHEERLRLLGSAFLQTSDGILIIKTPGEDHCCQEPVFVNAAFERITGFNLEDLKGGALALLYPPQRNPHAKLDRPEGFRRHCPTILEQSMNRKDGSEFWGEFTFKPLKDESGNYTHCVWTLRDVTERKQAEETAHLLSSVVENSNDAILTKNLDGAVVTWNKGAERTYGYTAEEIVGRSVSVLYTPERKHELLELLDDLRRGSRIEHFETERIRKDGSRILVSLTISPIENARGYVVGASVISRDITERRLAENALAVSEERYRSLAFATTSVVWTTNSSGEVTDDLPLWRNFTGQGPEELLGWGWINALHPDDRERAADIWSRAVNGRGFYDTEYRMRRHDGEYRWMSVHGVPVMAPDGDIREWVGTCADIHDRKMAEEQIRRLNEELEQRVVERTAELKAANQELESFAYSVSHDLRAPLRAVDGFSRILLEEYGPQLDSEGQRYLTMARKNAVQMGTLIDDLLAFSRLSRQPLTKQTVSPAALVRQVLEDLRPEREGRQVEITVGELPACEGDPQLLKQVYVNLLSNGLKYTSKREVARIEVGSSGRDVPVYYVRDNGVGFDMRYADKLFGVFQRLHGAQEYPGTGVGLAIVQRIVHRHGGRVWANAVVDQGATFYFVLSPAELAAQPDPVQQGNEELETCPTNS